MAQSVYQQTRLSSNANDVPPGLKWELKGVRRYLKRGRFLGKGTFACCFEFVDQADKKAYAAKVITKQILKERYQYDKVIQEVSIHTGLNHPNIVKLIDYFDDPFNVYIMLEVCSGRSLMELHQSRKTITETEARCFLTQIVSGVNHLHSNKIIHRDLKLANLFLGSDMTVKIGDFGLAVRESELKRCQMEKCGTPNYLSPEMLMQKGHSYPVDIWAIGVVLFTLLSGTPPFETDNLQETYRRIQSNVYKFTPAFGSSVRDLITHLLAPNPKDRPTASQICKHEFFTGQNCPKRLPLSSVVATPRIKGSRVEEKIANNNSKFGHTAAAIQELDKGFHSIQINDLLPASSLSVNEAHNISASVSLHTIIGSLESFDKLQILDPSVQKTLQSDDEYPAGRPICWVTRWVDASEMYGISYQLNNGSVGFLFRDKTKLIIDSTGMDLQYVDVVGNEKYYDFGKFPPQLAKKVGLIKSMRDFMVSSLKTSGEAMMAKEKQQISSFERWPNVLKCYIEIDPEIVIAFCTSDGSLQINFQNPYVKLIISSMLGAVTFILDSECYTYKLDHLCEPDCPNHVLSILKRAKEIAVKLLNQAE